MNRGRFFCYYQPFFVILPWKRHQELKTEKIMKEKGLLSIVLCVVATMLLGSCKGKQQEREEVIMAIDYTPPVITDPVCMDSITDSQQVAWMGSAYSVTVKRVPMESLPMVSNDYGQKYVDNSVTIVIRRPDGSEFYNQTFTKSAFNALLDADYRKNGLLANIRFEKTDGQCMEFSVSMAHVQLLDSEEMPLKLIIDSQKNIKLDYDDSYDIVPDYEVEN